MCCGRSTNQVLTSSRQAFAEAASQPSQNAPRISGVPSGAPRFEYVGNTALTVVSPITGKRYRFSKPGEQLEVDARDQSLLTFVPNLMRISPWKGPNAVETRGRDAR